jgi:hypothetical protein
MGSLISLRWIILAGVMVMGAGPYPDLSATSGQGENEHGGAALQGKTGQRDDASTAPADPGEAKREAARAALITKIRQTALAEVELAAKSVTAPDTPALAKALAVDVPGAAAPDAEIGTRSALRVLGDLESDGPAEATFRWSRLERYKLDDPDLGPVPAWVMFLLSWDGSHWRATELTVGYGVAGAETVPGLFSTDAIVVVDGVGSRPFPVIFQYRDHGATLAWDSRADESLYQSYNHGEIEFQSRENAPPVMIVTGRADPGVLRFSPRGGRGFAAATVYFWEQGAYVPRRTEFDENEDYTLYRFLAALHMRDFKTAFGLIDSAKFLEGRANTLEAFRKAIENSWPEFTGNSIFDAVEGPGQFAFTWKRGNDHFVYIPAFSPDGGLLLTGLERRQAQP